MQRLSPLKHRHDGTSPLPLGMDWSPPPRKWNRRETVWPHDPGTGWSYCVIIPSWVVRPKSRDSDPVVFYRVIVGIQSPDGVTSTRVVLRRFNDFLKLFAALKKAFPRKSLTAAPPKGLLRMKSRALLEERRCSLEEWLTKLLSDIDISRSVVAASFLELEAAARSSFQVENQHISESSSSVNGKISPIQVNSNSSPYVVAKSASVTSDYGSDVACETSDIGSPSFGRDYNSEAGTEDLSLDEDSMIPAEKLLKYGMYNIDEGLFMGQAILEQLEGFPSHKVLDREIVNATTCNLKYDNSSRISNLVGNTMELSSGPGNSKVIHHSHKLSAESVGSDLGSQRGSGLSNSAFLDTYENGLLDHPTDGKLTQTMEIFGNSDISPSDGHLIIPLDQRQKLNRVLMTMRRRLVTAKTDMEDLISRLNQEIAGKDYLTTKVKDLEVELEAVKQKSKENLEQAILVERERFTQMQWDMEELRRRSIEMELKLKAQQEGNPDLELTDSYINQEKNMLQQKLDSTRLHLEDLQKRHRELEAKSKADIKVLVKEVKSLRNCQAELKEKLNQSLNEKAEVERQFQLERHSGKQSNTARRKLLHDTEILRTRLHECNINLFTENNNNFTINFSLLSDAFDLLTISDNQINILLAEAQHLAQDHLYALSTVAEKDEKTEETRKIDEELNKTMSNLFVDNATLRKQLNALIRHAFKMDSSAEKDGQEDPSIEST